MAPGLTDAVHVADAARRLRPDAAVAVITVDDLGGGASGERTGRAPLGPFPPTAS